MNKKNYISAVLVLLMSLTVSAADIQSRQKIYQQALDLYGNGLYQEARLMFESIAGDPVADGYVILCALHSKSSDAEILADVYAITYGKSSFTPQIDFNRGVNRFERGDYPGALQVFNGIDTSALHKGQVEEYVFKRAYCLFDSGDADNAFSSFRRVINGKYSVPSRYYLALILYSNGRYHESEKYFKECLFDSRYSSLSAFYIVECEFKAKNYRYVINEGEKIFASYSTERREHLARLISESYLVLGDKEKAHSYYEQSSHDNMTMEDYFYAANVMMAVNDYAGAIDNFCGYISANDSRDSLWQLANYNLAGAYMKTHNQVKAMDAFKAASQLAFDPRMTEDACFNYAKLAFDLNKDTSGFAEYLKRYSTGKRDDIYTYMALAALYDRNYAAAVEAYDNIDYLTPDMRSNYAKANFLRACQLISIGSFTEAGKCFKAASYYLPRTDHFWQLSRYWYAETCYKTSDYATAAEVYTDLYNGSALYGQNESMLMPYNIAYCHFKLGDYDSAARWFDKYLTDFNAIYLKDAQLRRADCDFARKRYKEAAVSYGILLDETPDPNNIYPYFKQAMSYGLSGNRKMKLQVLQNVENASPSSEGYCEAMRELGHTYMDLKNNQEAIRTFTRLRQTASDSSYVAQACIGLGMVNRNMKNYDEALTCYKQVVSSMSGTGYAEDALAAIQSIYQAMGKPELYMEYVQQGNSGISTDDAKKEQLYFGTAEQIYLSGRYKDALNTFIGYAEEFPSGERIADAYFYIADSYRNMGNAEKACEYFLKVPSAAGGSFLKSALLNGASLSYTLERYPQALDAFTSLKRECSDSEEKYVAQLGILRSAYRARLYDVAIEAAETVAADSLSTDAIVREADYIAAKSYLSTSRRDKAIEEFRLLSQKAPSTAEGAEATCFLIQDLYDSGDFDKVETAVFDFSRKAGNQSYWLAKAYLILGDTFVQKGNVSQAKATFESIRDGYEPYGDNDEIPDNVKMRLERLANQ